MKKQTTKMIRQTFSIPADVLEDLHTFIEEREISSFISNAIRKELNTEKLRQAYRMANKNAGQIEVKKDWKSTIADGLDGY